MHLFFACFHMHIAAFFNISFAIECIPNSNLWPNQLGRRANVIPFFLLHRNFKFLIFLWFIDEFDNK